MKKKSALLKSSILLFSVILNIISWNSTKFSDWYISYIFPIWVNFYGRITAFFSFSIGEILIVLGVGLLLFTVISLICLLFFFAASYYTQSDSRWKKSYEKIKYFQKGYLPIFNWIIVIVILVMTLNCFILYHASFFSERYFEVVEEEITIDDLIMIRNHVVTSCNELSYLMDRDEYNNIIYTEDMSNVEIDTMKKLGKTYSQLDGYYPRLKPLLASDFLSQRYMLGYYFPFSMEANYNKVAYISNLPSTMCHELAHLRGYIYEDEANFISYLACIQSEDLFFQYSGYLSVLNYLDNDFYKAINRDNEIYRLHPGINALVKHDNIFLEQKEWDRIEEKALFKTETIDYISDVISSEERRVGKEC